MTLSDTQLRGAVAIVAIVFMASGHMEACPLCDSPTAHEVRAGLTGAGKGKIFTAMTTPFIVLLAGLRIYSVGIVNFFRLSKQ